MPEELTPVIREEEYLAAIAGQDVTPPEPATRKEEWLNAIAGRVDGLAEDVEGLGDIVPTPEAADEGKVLTAGADGTASWQTAGGGGGGGGFLTVKASGVCEYYQGSQYDPSEWYVGIDKTIAEITAAFQAGTPVLFCLPTFSTSEPYYDADTISAQILAPFMDSYEVKDINGGSQYSYSVLVTTSSWPPKIEMCHKVMSQV